MNSKLRMILFVIDVTCDVIYDIRVLRVVLDTNVLLSGLQSDKGASHAVLRQIGTQKFQHFISSALIYEYEEVLHRMREAGKLALNTDQIETFLTFIVQQGTPQIIYYTLRPSLNDPKDEHVLELAFNAACPYIITFNLKDFKISPQFGIEAIPPEGASWDQEAICPKVLLDKLGETHA